MTTSTAGKPEVRIVEQAIRDGQQSLWGMKMRAGQVLPAAQDLDQAGFDTVDAFGWAPFVVLMKEYRDNPWAGMRAITESFSHTPVRAATRSNSIIGFGVTPRSLVDLSIDLHIRNGVDSYWIFDCLYDVDEIERVCGVVRQAGGTPVPSIMYTLSDVHDDAYFADVVRRYCAFDGVSRIYVEDAGGVLTPERLATLLPAMNAELTNGIEFEFHCHDNTAMAALNYKVAVEHGVRILHTAARPLANGPSLPSTEMTLSNLDAWGFSTTVDRERLARISTHFEEQARRWGFPVGAPAEHDARAYGHQLPGGMTGTLLSQLRQYQMEHRFNEVLDELARVRVDLGTPVMATPFSQLMGIQAVLNVVSGERYSMTTDEVILYLHGHMGTVPGPVDPVAQDRILGTSRGQQWADWKAPEPTLDEVRQQHGIHLSDEELLLRALIPGDLVDKTLAAGGLVTAISGGGIPDALRSALTASPARNLKLTTADWTVELCH